LAVGNIEYVPSRVRDVNGYHHSTPIAMEEISDTNYIGKLRLLGQFWKVPWKCGEWLEDDGSHQRQ
jgi:hypothetical protein